MTTTLFPDHRPTWQTESHELLRDHARAFFAQEVTPRQADWARQGHVDRELWNRAGAAGLLLTDIADEDGGGGGDFGHEAVVAQELAYAHDSAFGFTVHSTIVSHYINAYGTEEQKRRWLPGLASGEKVVAGITVIARLAGFEDVTSRDPATVACLVRTRSAVLNVLLLYWLVPCQLHGQMGLRLRPGNDDAGGGA